MRAYWHLQAGLRILEKDKQHPGSIQTVRNSQQKKHLLQHVNIVKWKTLPCASETGSEVESTACPSKDQDSQLSITQF